MQKIKYFCIGPNKTGTSSLKKAFDLLGMNVADQNISDRLLFDWANKNYQPIIDFCTKYEAFQDIPFSLPDTFKILDSAFPKSKFILTIRESEETWYKSLTTSFSKKWGINGELPSAETLMSVNNIFEGKPYYTLKLVFGVTDEDLFNYNLLTQVYLHYLEEVRNHFKNRPQDLIIINIDKEPKMNDLAIFCNRPNLVNLPFPWDNKTSERWVK